MDTNELADQEYRQFYADKEHGAMMDRIELLERAVAALLLNSGGAYLDLNDDNRPIARREYREQQTVNYWAAENV